MRPRSSAASRAFAREVGIIILGVLIALGIGEVADDLRWSSRAAASNAETNKELALAAGVLDERVLAQPCLDRRLADLARIVRTAHRTGVLPDIRAVGSTPMRPVTTTSWDDVVASGTLLHLDAARRSFLALNYLMIKTHAQEITEEHMTWSELRGTMSLPGRVSDTVLAKAAGDIARLQGYGRLVGISAKQIRDDIVAHGIRPDYAFVLDRPARRSEVIESVKAQPVCRPLGAR